MLGWPAPAQGDPAPVTAEGSQPILVVGTTRDPATPYEWAQSLADQLDSGHLLTYVGDGHTAYRRGSDCIDDAVDAYLLEGKTPPRAPGAAEPDPPDAVDFPAVPRPGRGTCRLSSVG